MEEARVFATISEGTLPVLLIPKKCTSFESNCDPADNMYLDLNISSSDAEGNTTCVYSGCCNVRFIDSYDINVSTEDGVDHLEPSQSNVWIDPSTSPYVYNNCDDECEVYESHSSHVTEDHSTYVSQKYYKEAVHFGQGEEFDHRKTRPSQDHQTQYGDDELECGVLLSQLPDEIINKNEGKREELKYLDMANASDATKQCFDNISYENEVVIGMKEELKYLDIPGRNDSDALRQLMSSDIQSLSKQQRTIMYLGQDSQMGQTVQNIAIDDPWLQCADNSSASELVGESNSEKTNQKKYQCDKCKQLFDNITSFKQHIMVSHKQHIPSVGALEFMCSFCNKNLKTREKFEQHCSGHGDPDLECDKCHKVFASKFTLRNHYKIHSKRQSCSHCKKSFTRTTALQNHVTKTHLMFICKFCHVTSEAHEDHRRHMETHHVETRCNDETNHRDDDDDETLSVSSDNEVRSEEVREAESVLKKVMSNKMFLFGTKRGRRSYRCRKTCDVCLKKFDRISDLKRHLIEHVIRSTLAKTPVNGSGALSILCEVCQSETFTKIDKYKAHLREHAKLTLYKCNFCNKSFSDSSNFSKHKKIHGSTLFQCDLCQRKFNSKKMIAQHMERHNRSSPIACYYCGKTFYFKSMLNKHIKIVHNKMTRFKCRFCEEYFCSLKVKWDHEWTVHNVRKCVVDCRVCDCKFRKYSELKRHCNDVHNFEIPPAKSFGIL